MQNNVAQILLKFSNAYQQTYEKLINQVGLHTGQAQVLMVLWGRDGLSQAEISRLLDVSTPTVNLLVSKLQNKKFIKCKKCSKDKRLMRVYLTKKGLDVRDDAELQVKKIEDLILKDFSDTEKVLVLMLLEKIKKNLQTDFLDI